MAQVSVERRERRGGQVLHLVTCGEPAITYKWSGRGAAAAAVQR